MRQRLRLALEAAVEAFVGDFDGDLAPNARILRTIHDTHAAGANLLDDVVVTEPVTGRQPHAGSLSQAPGAPSWFVGATTNGWLRRPSPRTAHTVPAGPRRDRAGDEEGLRVAAICETQGDLNASRKALTRVIPDFFGKPPRSG